MKTDMSIFMNACTSGDVDTFDRLLNHHYRKFTRFYKVLKEYASLITKIKYEFKTKYTFEADVIFDTKRNMEVIKRDVESEMIKRNVDGDVEVIKKGLRIKIRLQEL